MLRSKIESGAPGILLYGITPPKQGNDTERLVQIAARQLERLQGLKIDGLVLYDIQDESCRNASPRPFPFAETIDPWVYAREYLSASALPKIIYSGVGRFDTGSFRNWLNDNKSGLEYLVLVGSPSRQQVSGLSLNEAYRIRKELGECSVLGGVTIPERHVKKMDEHLRVSAKIAAGCRFFISQCVYNVDNAKLFLTDYCDYLKKAGGSPVPIIFTLTPCGSVKTLQFMEWLGIEIPVWLRDDLQNSENMLMRSLEVCRSIVDELMNFAASVCVPIGFNVESVAVRKEEIEASLELVQYISGKCAG